MSVRRRAVLAAAVGVAVGAVGTTGGCGWFIRKPVIPMPVLRLAGPCVPRADTLVVMLPGASSLPQEFIDEGFIDAMRQRRIAADGVIADSHLGYFQDGSVLTRLRDDVIGPARDQGYQRIWLVGISLGGFGALGYGMQHGQDIDGIVALAPYLGQRGLLREIAAAGGPAAWRASAPAGRANDVERGLWRCLAAPAAGPGTPAPPIYLGFGSDDRLAEGHRLLAGALSADRVTQVPGGHDWPPWRALWQQWLARGLLPGDCSRPTA